MPTPSRTEVTGGSGAQRIPGQSGRTLAGWLARGVAVVAALISGIGGLTILPPLASQAGAYLADRNVGLAVLLLVVLALGWTRSLAVVLLVTAAMHLVDGAADIAFQNGPAAVGSFVVALLSILAGVYLLRESRRTGVSA